MYLSRLILNPRSRQARQLAADPYQLHRAVMKGFPDRLPTGERVLHRLDVDAHTGQMTLIVQSQTEPVWGFLTAGDVLLPADPFIDLENPAVKTVTLTFKPGQRLHFRLRANPVKRLPKDDPAHNLKKGQRIGLFKEKDQQSWLRKQGEAGGFKLLGTYVTDEGFSQGRTKDNHKFKHFAVRFDGVLQVTDPEQFFQTLNRGIGPAKAFGCGLLSLAPA